MPVLVRMVVRMHRLVRVLVHMYGCGVQPLVLMRVLTRVCVQVRVRGLMRVRMRMDKSSGVIQTVMHGVLLLI